MHYRIWWPWAEQKEGYECLLAQVKAGTIMARRHVRLPAESEIPWPRNQQVRYLTEKKQKSSGTGEFIENTRENEGQEAANDFDTDFEGRQLNMVPTSKSESSAVTQTKRGSALPEGMSIATPPSSAEVRDKVVEQHVRKVHNAWDKTKREFQATIDRSKNHVNTKGNKLEVELAKYIEEADQYDSQLVALEQKFLSNQRFSDDEVNSMGKLSTDVKELIKKGSKIAQAIKPWFSLWSCRPSRSTATTKGMGGTQRQQSV